MFSFETIFTTIGGMIASTAFASWFWWRRERKAAVKTTEANMADKMIAVMDRAFSSTIERLEGNITLLDNELTRKKAEFKGEIKTLKGINGKVIGRLAMLEAALIEIKKCIYRAQCPVVDKLQLQNADDIEQHIRFDKNSNDSTGHIGSYRKG